MIFQLAIKITLPSTMSSSPGDICNRWGQTRKGAWGWVRNCLYERGNSRSNKSPTRESVTASGCCGVQSPSPPLHGWMCDGYSTKPLKRVPSRPELSEYTADAISKIILEQFYFFPTQTTWIQVHSQLLRASVFTCIGYLKCSSHGPRR